VPLQSGLLPVLLGNFESIKTTPMKEVAKIPQIFLNHTSIIYKYRSWQECGKEGKKLINPSSLDLIENRAIYFSFPSNLNDPFDCSIPVTYGKQALDDEKLRMVAIQMMIDKNPKSFSYEKIIEIANELGPKKIRSLLEDTLQNMSNVVNNLYKVFSASQKSLNQLLWSHYANSHTGICIGLDPGKISQLSIPGSETTLIPGTVHYQSDYPQLDEILNIRMSDQNKLNLAKDILFTKGSSWKYEGEFRFIIQSEKAVRLILPKNCFKSFYIGLKMGKEKVELIDKLKSNFPDSKIFQVEMSKTHFRLVKKRIN
jgi:hypothetical protein